MKTAMQDTSLEAYFNNVLPDLGDRQYAVLRVFVDNPAMSFTNTELARELRWAINRVVPRVYELRGKGKNNSMKDNPLLVKGGKRICMITKHRAIVWQLNPDWKLGGFKID